MARRLKQKFESSRVEWQGCLILLGASYFFAKCYGEDCDGWELGRLVGNGGA
jgi:hypothetical protein